VDFDAIERKLESAWENPLRQISPAQAFLLIHADASARQK
jgi:hypothetical protein